jgi:phospholipid transport system substrate-binding protein
MKQLISILITAGLLATASVRADNTPPDVLARNITNEVVSIVKQDKELASGNKAKMQKLVETKVLPLFDFTAMTEIAMGRNWKKATPEQQQELVNQFRTLLVKTYSGALASVSEYRIEFSPLRSEPADEDVTVDSKVIKPGAPPIPIDYRLRKQDKGWKVIDVAVEGASLVTVYRNQFNSEIRRSGVEGLIASLQRRNKPESSN